MTDRPHRGAIDYEKLGDYFRALSVPTRIQLLHKLQLPRTSSEIELPPFRKDEGLRHDRVLSRQTVEEHLRKLEEVSLVRSRHGKREGQPVREYVVNQPRLFTMVDEVRRLLLIQTARGVARSAALTTGQTADDETPSKSSAMPKGPCLVLITGPFEGKAFALQGAGPWSVGRAPTSTVALDYDPFVSTENTEVRRDGARFVLRTLASSRNGTTLNWRLLDEEEAAPLEAGDTVGVGRSLLVARGV